MGYGRWLAAIAASLLSCLAPGEVAAQSNTGGMWTTLQSFDDYRPADQPPGPFEMPAWAPPEPATAWLSPPSSDGPGLLSYPPSLEPGPPPGEILLESPFHEVPAEVVADRPHGKAGFLQYAMVRSTWLPALGDDALGVTELNSQVMIAVPPFIRGTPLLLTPFFNAILFDGPDAIDLPPRVYETGLEFRWMNELSDTVSIDLAVAPSMYSDFDNTSSQAIRITGRALALYRYDPTVQVVSGIIYLDRDDYSMLPGAGVIWTPTPDHKFELIFPRPRIGRRVSVRGPAENWLYVAGEFGGNSWAIRRASGLDDVATYSDLRAVIGWERKSLDALGGRIELGYVFRRKLEYASGARFDPADTFMLRAELYY